MTEETVPGLDGANRQARAASFWHAWRNDGARASVLVGISGVGKTLRFVAPLLERAQQEGIVAITVDVPQNPIDLDLQIKDRLVAELDNAGLEELAKDASEEPNLAQALRLVLRAPALIVIDEFQNLLVPDQPVPVQPFSDQLAKIARRAAHGGCLWLVSNREIDPEWSEPFHTTILEPPSETSDVLRIVLSAIAMDDAEDRLPPERREEVAQRFGRNPRALQLLGNLLRFHDLNELIGEPQQAEQGIGQKDLAERIERSLLVKARAGLTNTAAEFLRDLSILREPAPMDLIEEMGRHLGDVSVLCQALQERFLLNHKRGLRSLHPLVHEIEAPRFAQDGEAARAAHRRVGLWYARRLIRSDGSPEDDIRLSLLLASAQHHLEAAGADDDLRDALDSVRPYLERRFNWTVRSPKTVVERNAQIDLLRAFLATPAAPSVHFHYAKLLKGRGTDEDLAQALPHAEWATVDQDFHSPWLLYCQIDYLVNGPDHAIEVARKSVSAVAPAKSLYAVYQLLGVALNHTGQDDQAIAALLDGTERSKGSEERLVEQALYAAAAMPTEEALTRVRDWAEQADRLGPQVALANILRDERRGAWRDGAERARIARRRFPTYLHLCLHEAFCWLGACDPEEAQTALDAFAGAIRLKLRESSTWLAAFIALRTGDPTRARDLAAIYAGAAAPASPEEIEALLLHEWDHRVATLSEPNPALTFPVLPPALSGLQDAVIRSQHGPPVLPRHQPEGDVSGPVAQPSRKKVLSVATEWGSGHGGLSTLNRQLCIALAAAGLDVDCYVIDATPEEIRDAREEYGVTLLLPPPTPGVTGRELLADRPGDLDHGYSPDFIIGHGRITGPAAFRLKRNHFPASSRLHFLHMAPDEIERFKTRRDEDPLDGVDAATVAEARSKMEWDLARDADSVVAIGPRLQGRYESDLVPRGSQTPLRLDPGFDAVDNGPRQVPGGSLLRILVMGRAEDWPLKGLDLAAAALGRLATERVQAGQRNPTLDLIVRGAKPELSTALEAELRNAAGSGYLEVTVRNYSTNAETLADDIASSSLVLMPSRNEGFGLVGLEAIISATPVLVSSRSGLAELLREILNPERYQRVAVEMSQNDEEDISRWKSAIEGALRNRDASFADAYALQRQLSDRLPWRGAVASLLNALGVDSTYSAQG